jgi:hypothetical protein
MIMHMCMVTASTFLKGPGRSRIGTIADPALSASPTLAGLGGVTVVSNATAYGATSYRGSQNSHARRPTASSWFSADIPDVARVMLEPIRARYDAAYKRAEDAEIARTRGEVYQCRTRSFGAERGGARGAQWPPTSRPSVASSVRKQCAAPTQPY